jgi:hypothetical protein
MNIVKKKWLLNYYSNCILSLIIWATAFSQPLLHTTRSKKKRKPAKNSSNTLWVKPQRVFAVLDDIGRARQNIVKMTISRSRDALCDTCATFTRRLCDRSAKNRKIDKKRKYTFFVNFLHVLNRTRVRNEV